MKTLSKTLNLIEGSKTPSVYPERLVPSIVEESRGVAEGSGSKG